jgi:hypothetical protein
MLCELCGRDPGAVEVIDEMPIGGHGCHCIHIDGLRIAVGICCGRKLGASVLTEEDAADARRLAREPSSSGRASRP